MCTVIRFRVRGEGCRVWGERRGGDSGLLIG